MSEVIKCDVCNSILECEAYIHRFRKKMNFYARLFLYDNAQTWFNFDLCDKCFTNLKNMANNHKEKGGKTK